MKQVAGHVAQLIFDPEDGGNISIQTFLHKLTTRRYTPKDCNIQKMLQFLISH
jgi:hypothetical protein